MEKAQVLIVDDEKDILELLRYNLTKDNYLVVCAGSGEQALQTTRQIPSPDLVILDLMLPGINGLEVCRQLKQQPATAHIPIIMLTARGEEADIVVGLELGADDYMTKPFSPRVLLARVNALLRRKREKSREKVIKIEDLLIDLSRHIVQLDEKSIYLTNYEFAILLHLAQNRGMVFTRNQLLDAVQGEDAAVVDRTIDVHIASLRKKLNNYGNYIETIRSIGYRFKD
ncbi:MAG: response regulator [Candidatus Schekmanbacteria bacterium]|nr:response regulator [Candidatus Schekmanbacteria bacterium]